MFKGFQSKSRQFNGFPNLNFQVNNERFGFSGAVLDLDARYSTNTTTDGASISSWVDTIGNIAFTQSTAANQPIFDLNNPSFNNLPAINFNASAKTLLSPVTIGVETILCICENTTINAQQNILLGSTNANNSSDLRLITGGVGTGYTGIGYYSGLATSPTSITSSTIENTIAHIFVLGTGSFIIDGVSYTASTQSISFGRLSNTTTTASFLGYVTRIVGYKRIFTDADALVMCKNANNEYAVY